MAAPRPSANRSRHPDHRGEVLSPAARAIIRGAMFGGGYDGETLYTCHVSADGAMSDEDVVWRQRHEDDALRQSLSAVQMRGLRRMIVADDLAYPPGPTALACNRAQGRKTTAAVAAPARPAAEGRA